MKNIAIVCGGNSGEYEISVKSAGVVKKHLPKKKYKSYIIEIKGAEWNLINDNGEKIPVDKSDFSVGIGNKKINSMPFLMPFTATRAKTAACKHGSICSTFLILRVVSMLRFLLSTNIIVIGLPVRSE